MIFAVAGYVLGCLVCLISGAPVSQWIIYLEYLLSGLLIFGCNKLLHRKASGHACGVAALRRCLFILASPHGSRRFWCWRRCGGPALSCAGIP